MSDEALTLAEAATLLYTEARLLDERRWDEWLAMYVPDAVFWMPAWRNELETTVDPERELSLIYYRGRRNLEDRIDRVRSGLSTASSPLPRTNHLVSNVMLDEAREHRAVVQSRFTTHVYDARSGRTSVYFGRYSHELRLLPEGWRIAVKQVLLLNDVIPTALDVYAV